MKWYRSALVCAAGLAALVLTGGVAPVQGAKADSPIISTWTDWNSGQCLGVLGANMTNGTQVVQWPCDGTANQTWEIQYTDGWTQVRNGQDLNKCLGVLGGATAPGSQLVIWDCNGNPDQTWFFKSDFTDSPGCYYVVNYNASSPPGSLVYDPNDPSLYTPFVMGVWGGQTAPGIETVVWPFEPTHPDQFWC